MTSSAASGDRAGSTAPPSAISRGWLWLGVALAVGGAAYAFWPRSAGPQSALEISPNPIRFGSVPWLSNGTQKVTIKNRSRREVVLRDPRFDCSCFQIAQNLGRVRLSPGESTEVVVVILTQKGEPGRFHKTFSIESDDPVQRKVDVPVLGAITDFREVSPRQVLFGDVTADSEPVTKTVTVRGGKNWRVAVKDVATRSSWIELKTTPTADGAEIAVTTKKGLPGATKGALDAPITMTLEVSGGVDAAGESEAPRRYPESVWARAIYK